jgi:RNA polymerase sigma-70 factor (family 1)
MRSYATLPDDELVPLIRKGDEGAFTEAYRRYWDRLLAIGYYYTHDKAAAEDVVHEVFTGLWVRREVVPVQHLAAYLATAVKFSVFKALARDKRRRDILQSLPLTDSTNDIEAALDARFLHNYLQGVVEQLPPTARLVFTYSRAEALSVKEIATRLDLSPKAVEYHLTKALRALKEASKKIKSFFV